jgi:alkylated DNA repair protein alkB family protein 1
MDAAFKRYKSRCDPLNFKDPELLHKFEHNNECHTLDRHPGFYHFSQVLTKSEQIEFTKNLLSEYAKPPHARNSNTNGVEIWQTENQTFQQKYKKLQKLRWVTLGYHHDWDTKVYSETSKSKVPDYIFDLAKKAAEKLDKPEVLTKNYTPEACIANLYYPKSTLSAHTDHSEKNFCHPILSYSIGLPAVFLIGGKCRKTVPTAVLLEPGDLVIMSENSRLAFHSVPRILTEKEFPEVCQVYDITDLERKVEENSEVHEYEQICELLSLARININIRQVF